MDEAEFAELPDKLDVAQHFDLCNSTLLLFLRSERAILFFKHYTDKTFIIITNTGWDTFCNQSHVSSISLWPSTFRARFSNSSWSLEMRSLLKVWKKENNIYSQYLLPKYKIKVKRKSRIMLSLSLTLFCFCTAWLSVDKSSKFGTSSDRRWHSWAYNWLYLDSSRALSTIL